MKRHLHLSIVLLLGCLPLTAGGCSGVQFAQQALFKTAEITADARKVRVEDKLAEFEDRLRHLKGNAQTSTETTLAMELNQGLEIQDITVDVEELKNVIATAEARARAEALRQERLPGLLREQQEALPGGPVPNPGGDFLQLGRPANSYGAVRPASNADIVVGIDQCGKPLPIRGAPKPVVAPADIPYVVRLRVNLGIDNPRLEKSKIRRVPPACDAPDCGGAKGCPRCAMGPAYRPAIRRTPPVDSPAPIMARQQPPTLLHGDARAASATTVEAWPTTTRLQPQWWPLDRQPAARAM